MLETIRLGIGIGFGIAIASLLSAAVTVGVIAAVGTLMDKLMRR